jgi:hypothetical protein
VGRTLAAVVLLLLAFAAPAAAANPIALENSRPGNGGWEIPPGAGTLITGYASETSVAPGQTFHLHVEAPVGSPYRVLVYRLGWYRGLGGRLIMCLPGCGSSRIAVAQPPPSTPNPLTGLLYAPWRVTDRLAVPRDAVSGYYEAKLEVVGGPYTGAIGSIPLIVRQSPTARPAAMLVQVPVNTWEAYNPWGGRSLYAYGTPSHAIQVSFDRPYDQQEFAAMQTGLELPWVRFLERNGFDVAYQTDQDTDRDPASLLAHRLVFSIGHDEYWTKRMYDAFMRAKALGTNLMFGSNAALWRMRYASGRRTILESRSPQYDGTGFAWSFGDPPCRLMGVEYQEYTQRWIGAPPTPYTVVGPAGDPWLAAAGLQPGQLIPGVVGYEWDELIPGCFPGQVVPLMQASLPGSDGRPTTAEMVRATAHSGARVFAMGTMELCWALDSFDGHTPNPQVVAFVRAALADLLRPAPPAALRIRRADHTLLVTARLRAPDPRIRRVSVHPLGGGRGCSNALHTVCRLPLPRHARTYAAVAIDPWGASEPLAVRVRPAPARAASPPPPRPG